MHVSFEDLNYKKGLFICQVDKGQVDLRFYKMNMKGKVRADRLGMKMMFSGWFELKEGKFNLHVNPDSPDSRGLQVRDKQTVLEMKLKQKVQRLVSLDVSNGASVDGADESVGSDDPSLVLSDEEKSRPLSAADQGVLEEALADQTALETAYTKLSEDEVLEWEMMKGVGGLTGEEDTSLSAEAISILDDEDPVADIVQLGAETLERAKTNWAEIKTRADGLLSQWETSATDGLEAETTEVLAKAQALSAELAEWKTKLEELKQEVESAV